MALLGAALADGMPLEPCPLSDGSALAQAGQKLRLPGCGLWRLCCLEGMKPAQAEAILQGLEDKPDITEDLPDFWRVWIDMDTIE